MFTFINRSIQNSLRLLALAACAFFLSACWTFDDGTKQGFTIDGAYNGGSYESDTLCSDAQINSYLIPIRRDSHTFKDNPEAASLRMSIPSFCFLGQGDSGFTRFDFVSPKPTHVDWQGSDGFSFAMKTNLPNLQIQPLLSLRKADGSIVKRRSSSGPQFLQLPNSNVTQWTVFDYSNVPLGPGEDLLAVHIRVFIPHATLVYAGLEAVVMLDDVIPNKT